MPTVSTHYLGNLPSDLYTTALGVDFGRVVDIGLVAGWAVAAGCAVVGSGLGTGCGCAVANGGLVAGWVGNLPSVLYTTALEVAADEVVGAGLVTGQIGAADCAVVDIVFTAGWTVDPRPLACVRTYEHLIQYERIGYIP
ncbi:hypothetical protein ONS96_001702 [Cadophora gregata f. sp. sojae]|nr:hypothetical protein ONS96_001702 [Cadophora gregata f. sp. sojae]